MIKTSIKATKATITVNSLQEIDKAIKAFETIGLSVKKITTDGHTYAGVDLDTKFYNRYPEQILDKIYNALVYGMEQELIFKNNRLYASIDGTEIVLPKTLCNSFSDEQEITLKLYI